ncbi:hypothetical protein [Streptomyces arboris]|uniref:hypothetical protein n=1 Tax=Streptomyces arboris TaxID=2600619 RepID=UPI001CEF59B0|nr:hypothetical protein [Streptomyces arboris]
MTVGVAAGICLILVDRALLWAERRGWIYYRTTKGRTSALLEEFSPAAQAVKRAMEQERIRKNVRPAEGPPLGVDLDKGVARIRHSQPGLQESANSNEIKWEPARLRVIGHVQQARGSGSLGDKLMTNRWDNDISNENLQGASVRSVRPT